MIQIRLREEEVRVLVDALSAYLAGQRRAAADAGARESGRGRRARSNLLASVLRRLTEAARAVERRLQRAEGAVAEPVRAIPPGRLTERQQQVLRLVASGQSTKQIARNLGVSIKTVEFHRGRIMKTLGVRSIAELTRYALAHDIAER